MNLLARLRNTPALLAGLLVASASAQAQLTIPYGAADGSDGQLVVTTGTNVINLGNAGTGSWTNTSANPGLGTYDASQWAVIYKYSNVVIAANTLVRFSNHITHAPVIWLVSGNVTINGELNLDGQPWNTDPVNLPEPGPGGFRGGGSRLYGNGPGFGPGGGSFIGAYAPSSYGNPQIVPLIGGSGGNGSNDRNAGAGGGAILIVATGSITVNGKCQANGGGGSSTGAGSGGAIRLVANQLSGNGSLIAVAGNGTPNGRIRLEANGGNNSMTINPPAAAAIPGNPVVLFPPTNGPIVMVSSIGGVNPPTDPKAIMSSDTQADDVALVTTNNVTIQLQTMNFPTNGTVTVFINPRNAGQSVRTATFVTGTTNAALWQVLNVALPYPAHTVIQARAAY